MKLDMGTDPTCLNQLLVFLSTVLKQTKKHERGQFS